VSRRPFAVRSSHAVRHADACRDVGSAYLRDECERDMDRRIAEVIGRGVLSRGAALALHGEVVETHPEDPCSAHRLLTRSLEELVPA
jgi:hypothetical protein